MELLSFAWIGLGLLGVVALAIAGGARPTRGGRWRR